MASESAVLCPDWVFSNNSNVHLAKDRAWFTDYTPFESVVSNLWTPGTMPVKGIGTVELTNVLHAPSALCNIIGGPIIERYKITFGSAWQVSKGSITDREGRAVAYFDPRRPLFQVRLRGPPVGPRVLQDDGAYVISVLWPESERQRWEAHQASVMPHSRPGYTQEEKEWLRENYRSEFHFLRDFGLSIYEDDDREEGRTILRSLMQEEDEGDEEHTD